MVSLQPSAQQTPLLFVLDVPFLCGLLGNNASATTTNNFNSTNAANASGNSNEAEEESVVTNVLETLKTCVDNLQFQTGSLDGLDVFVSHRSFPVPTAFSAGNPGQMEQLCREIIQTKTTATHAS